jgi:hypothetical protein
MADATAWDWEAETITAITEAATQILIMPDEVEIISIYYPFYRNN